MLSQSQSASLDLGIDTHMYPHSFHDVNSMVKKKRSERMNPPPVGERFFQLIHFGIFLLGQWLNFKLLWIPYLVGKISRSSFFFQGPGRLSKFLESTEHLNLFSITLPETNSLPLQIVRAPKANNRIPTIHFQVLWLLVSGRVNVDESHSMCFGIVLMRG